MFEFICNCGHVGIIIPCVVCGRGRRRRPQGITGGIANLTIDGNNQASIGLQVVGEGTTTVLANVHFVNTTDAAIDNEGRVEVVGPVTFK